MLSLSETKIIAANYISTVNNHNLALTGAYEEFGEGVVYYYQRKKFLETNDFQYFSYGGLHAFIVNKIDGTIFHFTKYDVSAEKLIELFKQQVL